MAPERQSVGAGFSINRELSRHENEWPTLPRFVRQIQQNAAEKDRTVRRIEIGGNVIENFDAIFAKREKREPSPAHQSSIVKRHETVVATTTNSHKQVATVNLVKREVLYCDEENEAEEGGGGGSSTATEDNDLTSLSWLHDSNLIRSINLSKGENDELRPVTIQISPQPSGASPTSDYLDDSFTSEPADSCSSDQQPTSPCVSPAFHTPVKNMIPAGYVASSKSSNNSSSKTKHPTNVPYNPLVHTQNKPPYSFSCLIFMAIEDSPKKALPVKDIYSWILEHFPYFRSAPNGWKNSVRHNLSLNKCFIKVEKVQSLGKGSLWMVDGNYRSNLLQAFNRSPFHPCCPTARSPSPSRPPSPVVQERVSNPEVHSAKGAPNPKLFPYLARQLAASKKSMNDSSKEVSSDHDSCDSLDEVVAAAMVLALKHGPGVIPPPLISSCPTQDHTYSAATGSPETGYGSDEEQRRTAEALLHLAGLPFAPEPVVEESHKPRLIRRAPKRPAHSTAMFAEQSHQLTINNNCGSQTDRNLLRAKRPSNHPL